MLFSLNRKTMPRFSTEPCALRVRASAKSRRRFSAVLKLDPTNFHARFNCGLFNLDRKRFRDAAPISSPYPSVAEFYPAFYACRSPAGDGRTSNARELWRT